MEDRDCTETCACRAGIAYIPAGQRIGWDLTAGQIFAVVTIECGRGFSLLLASPNDRLPRKHIYLREAGLRNDNTNHNTMHSFRVGGSLTRPLAGTAAEEIMKIGGLRTELLVK